MGNKFLRLAKHARSFYNGVFHNAPIQVTLFVTARCNIRCKMCFYWEPVETKNTGEITLEEVEKISKNMPPFFWLIISGGEPFVRKDLPKIIKTFYDNNGIRHLSIPTNATYAQQTIQAMREILTECPQLSLNLNLSLNGIGKSHDELCQQKGVFEKFLVTYKKITALKEEFKNIGLGLSITHSKYTQEELGIIIDFVVNNLPGIDNIAMQLVRGRPKQKSALNVDIRYYKNAVKKIEDYTVQKKIRSFQTAMSGVIFARDMVMRRIIANTAKSGFQIPCLAGRISLVIDEHANVYPCEMLASVGSLRENDYDIKKILKGGVLQEAIKKIKEEHCYCTHECSYSTNILFNYHLWLTILKCYAQFKFKRLTQARFLFNSFDDLKLPVSSAVISQHDGQEKKLYEGRTFGVVTKA